MFSAVTGSLNERHSLSLLVAATLLKPFEDIINTFFIMILALYFSRHTAFVFASSANPIIYAEITASPISGDHPSRVCGAPIPY